MRATRKLHSVKEVIECSKYVVFDCADVHVGSNRYTTGDMVCSIFLKHWKILSSEVNWSNNLPPILFRSEIAKKDCSGLRIGS